MNVIYVLRTVCNTLVVAEARHFNRANHSSQNMAISSVPLYQSNMESHKTVEQSLIFQGRAVNSNRMCERFSFN